MAGIVTSSFYELDQAILPVSGNTPFGYYDNDTLFQTDAPKFIKFSYYRLGGGAVDVELIQRQYYAALEDAVNVYGKEIYEYKIRENYLSLEGNTTGSNLNTTLIQPNLGNLIRIAKDYGSEAGSGGNVTYYSGSLHLTTGQQYYDLNYWASQSASLTPGDAIEVKRIFYEAPPAILRYFDPYAGTGNQLNNLMDSFGFGSYSPGINFQLMPVYFDVLKVQAIEFNDQIRRSAFTFEIQNNRLRIFPVPAFDRVLWFTYIKESERNSVIRNTSSGLVTNISNVPYTLINYNQINDPGKTWIRAYALANCKEILGMVRGKHNSNPYPGTEISVNGQMPADQSQTEKDKLIEQLRATLEETSRTRQMEKKAQEADNMMNTLANIPMPYFIG